MSAIKEVTGLEVLDSRGNPTVEAEVVRAAREQHTSFATATRSATWAEA